MLFSAKYLYKLELEAICLSFWTIFSCRVNWEAGSLVGLGIQVLTDISCMLAYYIGSHLEVKTDLELLQLQTKKRSGQLT